MPAPTGEVTDTEPLYGEEQAVFAVGLPSVMDGAVELFVTVPLDVFVQPLLPVTVTVNVPD